MWKRGCFAWEYKGKHANFDAAFNQLRQYALALENPPLPIVSDMARFRIRTNWTNSVSETHEFALEDLADGGTRDRLKWAMSDPERLRPGETRQTVTERAAATFAEPAQSLRDRGARSAAPIRARICVSGRLRADGHGAPRGSVPRERLAPLILMTFRATYIMATGMRNEMLDAGREEELDELVAAARGLQEEVLGRDTD